MNLVPAAIEVDVRLLVAHRFSGKSSKPHQINSTATQQTPTSAPRVQLVRHNHKQINMYSGSGRSRYGGYSYGNSTSIHLPPGMSPGAIIGKGGSNIKMIQSRSGARVVVNRSGAVEISGSASAVQEAKRLVQLQISTFEATGELAGVCLQGLAGSTPVLLASRSRLAADTRTAATCCACLFML